MSEKRRTNSFRSVAWTFTKTAGAAMTFGAAALALVATAPAVARTPVARAEVSAGSRSYIVEAATTQAAARGVSAVHGQIQSALPGVHGVEARLRSSQVMAARHEGLRVYPNLAMHVQGIRDPQTTPSDAYNQVSGASTMWNEGIKGSGVTVAVLDTGINGSIPDLHGRVIGGVNLAAADPNYGWNTDQFGHGTFVAGLIGSDGASSYGKYKGVAPQADLVSIKVAGSSGITTEATVIKGIDWAISNHQTDNIGVLNISLGVEPAANSSLDPLDQAVESAWTSGIVVVVSAGNYGPGNGSIASPGNDPLVITVGAMDDGAADNPANYSIVPSSSVGPTLFDGWFKPDLVASGESVVSVMPRTSTISRANPSARIGEYNFVGTGTSFSAAIVSGLCALLLEQHPALTPDQVKAALLLGADPGPVGDPFVDGHGIADVVAASSVAGHVDLDQGPALAAEAKSTSTRQIVSLATTWAASSWNPANWSGPAWVSSSQAAAASTASGPLASGLSWNGAAWNGAAWTGAAWNGAAWNGAAWNGAAWTGAAWNGAAWNALAWLGAAWNGAAWNVAGWG